MTSTFFRISDGLRVVAFAHYVKVPPRAAVVLRVLLAVFEEELSPSVVGVEVDTLHGVFRGRLGNQSKQRCGPKTSTVDLYVWDLDYFSGKMYIHVKT